VFPLPPLTDEQRAVVERVAALSRDRFAARAARYDADSTFPYENYADLHAAGLHALAVPREYGGVGADPVTYVHALREIARGCSATALTLQHALHRDHLPGRARHPEQKRRYFGEVVGRGARIASITSEPEQSFRDKFVLNTVFRPTGDGGYRVAGVKQFCSLGDAADYFFVTGILEGQASARDGVISAMIPSRDAGGEDRGHLERDRHAGHHQPHHPLRLRGRGRQRGGPPRRVPHHRPPGLRPRLRRGSTWASARPPSST